MCLLHIVRNTLIIISRVYHHQYHYHYYYVCLTVITIISITSALARLLREDEGAAEELPVDPVAVPGPIDVQRVAPRRLLR